jgi:PAS domain S-box-containing protein
LYFYILKGEYVKVGTNKCEIYLTGVIALQQKFKMRKSLKKELFGNILVMMFLIAIIVVAGIVGLLIQKNNLNKIIIEYREINAIYDLSYSLKKTTKSAYSYLFFNNAKVKIEFEKSLNELDATYKISNSIITERHSKRLFSTVRKGIEKITFLGQQDLSKINDVERKAIYNEIERVLNKIDQEIMPFQEETKKELDKYISIDNKIRKSSIILITIIGLIIIFGSFFWGLYFVRKRTAPIIQLIDFTQKVGEGNFNIRSDIKFGNELDLLTTSFNIMLETLTQTTISKDYLNNIINSIVDIIIVTDSNGKIKLINKATIIMLGYEENELLGENIMFLFPNIKSNPDLLNRISLTGKNVSQDKEFVLNTKDNHQISVLISTSNLKKVEDGSLSTILVARDVTEKIKIENQLEVERKERSVAIFEAQEEERLRLAGDLHDGLGQMLTGIMYFIENNFNGDINGNEMNQKTIKQLQLLIDSAIKETKSISHNIIPMLLKDFGLVIAIKKIASQINSNNDFNINIDEFNFDSRLDARIEKILYRVCQEALNNILKHSLAKNINIHLIKHDHSVVLLIDDDGVGFEIEKVDRTKNFSGIGLISMKERVSALNGVFSISSGKNKGTEILIEIPC